ncbi:nucleotide sugar dehydrogenase [Colletotrichum graminicola]|uniref:Nucleotide sugar dehydrogenase n=1 Tax=Colletotrichum graminicola (strain M1.001 / M2 / FGSC 10212) TaxID=645133 RepID=E3Q206_COLGM|nr:nucleotide sugar dehydrogenase [Colletotrichum graminicola M1.001]EFQ25107.1 nucleotide sugar dehydrogenase [Colletotrichum graminicola M1.001]WDK15285.1 nucleotide sugar dehydrogenase [Colletotrichum graminicola]
MKITIDKPFTHSRSLSVPVPETPPLEALGLGLPGFDSFKSTMELPLTPVTPPPEYIEHSFLHNDKTIDVSPTVDPNDQPLVAVIGVGYVGTHLVESFSAHYNVLGFDVSERRINEIRKELPSERIRFTTCKTDLREATHFLISVPTLLKVDKSIDTSYLQSAIATVAQHARPGSTVVVESSVAVGMTRSLLGPVALSRGFYAGMSPERVDPGRTEPPCHAIPKIVSGLDDSIPGSLASIMRLYGQVFDRLVPVSRTEVAEMMKLYENCQRMMCIAFANEMADACIPHGIDPYEVAAAASSKPFGYMPYTPSLGVGGHCIPVNPYYLLSNSDFPLLGAAAEKMAARPAAIARRAIASLAKDAKTGAAPALVRPRVLVVGVGFKAGQSVLSNSPGVDLVHEFVRSGEVDVMFADPLVKQNAVPAAPRLADEKWNRETLETFDMIIVSFRQHGMDFGVLEDLRGVKVEMWCT